MPNLQYRILGEQRTSTATRKSISLISLIPLIPLIYLISQSPLPLIPKGGPEFPNPQSPLPLIPRGGPEFPNPPFPIPSLIPAQ
ncbi:hypothetical protein FDUTEX481_01093 [Tolypothrix sp. PCC 7601]|nr:hypothetical protein FDUTEX481_01093 [Tolypothrix sp. PCC 7601]